MRIFQFPGDCSAQDLKGEKIVLWIPEKNLLIILIISFHISKNFVYINIKNSAIRKANSRVGT